MDGCFEMKLKLTQEMCDYFGIDETSVFSAYFKRGKLYIHKCTLEELEEYSEMLSRYCEESFSEGYRDGFAEGAVVGAREHQRHGYARGFFDAQHGYLYNNEYPDIEEEEDGICPDCCNAAYCGECDYYDAETNTCALDKEEEDE